MAATTTECQSDPRLFRVNGVSPFVYTQGQADGCYGDLPWKLVQHTDAAAQFEWLEDEHIRSWSETLNREVLKALLSGELETLHGYVKNGLPPKEVEGPVSSAERGKVTDFLRKLLFTAVIHSCQEKVVRWLLENGADVDAQDPHGTSALILAAWYGSEDMVRLLLKLQGDPNRCDSKGITPLMAASYKGYSKIVKVLIMYDSLINEVSHARWTALEFGVIKGHQEMTDVLMSKGKADTNIADSEGRTPIVVAIMTGHLNIIQLLRSFDADLNYRSLNGATVLMAACQVGHRHIVKYLLQKGALINVASKIGMTALMCAVMSTHADVAAQLLNDTGIEGVEEKNALGNSSLMMAVSVGDLCSVKLLLLFGADMNSANNCGNTPKDVARMLHFEDICALFAEFSSDSGRIPIENSRKHRRLLIAAMTKNVDFVRREVAKGVREADKDYLGRTLLMAASYWGDMDIVKLLIKHSAKVNQQSHSGATALAYAVQGHQWEVFEYLLQQGADTELVDAKHRTLLSNCIATSDSEVLQMIINAGADIFHKDMEGKNALMLSAEHGHIDMLKILVSCGARIESKSKENMCSKDYSFINNHTDITSWLNDAEEGRKANSANSELITNCVNGNTDVVAKLLASGTDVNLMDSMGNTALTHASGSGQVSIVKMLVSHGAICNSRSPLTGRTALFKAVLNGQADTVCYLLSNKANPNLADKEWQTPLMTAAQENHITIATSLINHGAYVLKKNVHGWSALTFAANKGHSEMIKLLLDHNAVIDDADRSGTTALGVAAYRGNTDAVILLIEHGADINYQDQRKRTPLMDAVQEGHCDVAIHLLEHNARTELANTSGQVVFDIAVANNHRLLVQIFHSYGLGPSINQENAELEEYDSEVSECRQEDMEPYRDIHHIMATENLERGSREQQDTRSCNWNGDHENVHDLDQANRLSQRDEEMAPSEDRGSDALILPIPTTFDNYPTATCEEYQRADDYEYSPLPTAGSPEVPISDAKVEGTDRLNEDLKGETSENCNNTSVKPSPLQDTQSEQREMSMTCDDKSIPLDNPSEKETTESSAHKDDDTHDHIEIEQTKNNASPESSETVEKKAEATIVQSDTYHITGAPLTQVSQTGSGQEQLTIDNVEDLNALDSDGDTPLIVAIRKCHMEVVIWLLTKGADVNCANVQGLSPLMCATKSSQLQFVKCLVDRGADINATDVRGRSVLFHAAHNPVLVKYLLSMGVQLDQQANFGATPLMKAARIGEILTVRLLLQEGASVTAKDKKGKNVLMHCCQGKFVESANVISCLFCYGSPLLERDNDGMSALDWSIRVGNLSAIDSLMSLMNLKTVRSANVLIALYEGYPALLAGLPRPLSMESPVSVEVTMLKYLLANEQQDVIAVIHTFHAWSAIFRDSNWMKQFTASRNCATGLIPFIEADDLSALRKDLYAVLTDSGGYGILKELLNRTEEVTTESGVDCIVCDIGSPEKAILTEEEETDPGDAEADLYNPVDRMEVLAVVDEVLSTLPEEEKADYQDQVIAMKLGLEEKEKMLMCHMIRTQYMKKDIPSLRQSNHKTAVILDQLEADLEKSEKVLILVLAHSKANETENHLDNFIAIGRTGVVTMETPEKEKEAEERTELQEKLALMAKEGEDTEEKIAVLNVVLQEELKTREKYRKQIDDLNNKMEECRNYQSQSMSAYPEESCGWTNLSYGSNMTETQKEPNPVPARMLPDTDPDKPWPAQTTQPYTTTTTTTAEKMPVLAMLLLPPTTSPNNNSNPKQQQQQPSQQQLLGNVRKVMALSKQNLYNPYLTDLYLFQFHSSISQISIDGRKDLSTACAIISMLFAYKFLRAPSDFPEYSPVVDVPDLVFDQVEEAIRQGIAEHETNYHGMLIDLGPEEVRLMTAHLGVELIYKTDVDTREPDTLISHVEDLQPNQVILFIKNYRVVSILPCNDNRWLLLFDSHPHYYYRRPYGAYLFYGRKERETIRELFSSYEYFCDPQKFYGQFAVFQVPLQELQ